MDLDIKKYNQQWKRVLKPKALNILTIDDNPADANLLKEAFNEASINCNFHYTKDGIQALLFLRKLENYQHAPTPDTIVLDLNMPKIHGFEMLAEIKSDKDLKHIPVIILSSSDNEEDIKKCFALKANNYLSKPAEFNQYIKIAKYIEEILLIERFPLTKNYAKV